MNRTSIFAVLLAATAFGQVPPGNPNGNQPGPQQQRAPEPIPEFAAQKSVPHGAIHITWYDSRTFGTQRRLHVYTPPGYERDHEKYPVLYLFAGAGSDDSSWTGGIRVQFVLDNLLAAGKIKPMIVVMPAPGGPGPGGDNSPEGLAVRAQGANKSRMDVVDDTVSAIIPYVEANYRVIISPKSRAVAGFSFGGADSLWLGTGHQDKFAWVATFAMGIQGGSNAGVNPIAGSGSAGTPDEFVKANPKFFADSEKTNASLKMFYVGVGKDDNIVVDGPRQLSATLTAHGIHNEYHEIDGGHSSGTARLLLMEFVQKIFR